MDGREIALLYAQRRIDFLKSKLTQAKHNIAQLRNGRSNINNQKFTCVCFECGQSYENVKCLELHHCFTKKKFDSMLIQTGDCT